MPDQIAVPQWLLDLYDTVLGFIPDIRLGDITIPDWFVLIFLVGLIGAVGNEMRRRREHRELIASMTKRPPPE